MEKMYIECLERNCDTCNEDCINFWKIIYKEEIMSKERKCPECGNIESFKFKMERCIDGYTTCLVCQYMDKHNKFYQVESKELTPKEALERLYDNLNSDDYTDDYQKHIPYGAVDDKNVILKALTQLEEYIKRDTPIDYYMNEYGATCYKCNHVLFYGNDLCYELETSIGDYCDGCGQKQTKKRNRKYEM